MIEISNITVYRFGQIDFCTPLGVVYYVKSILIDGEPGSITETISLLLQRKTLLGKYNSVTQQINLITRDPSE